MTGKSEKAEKERIFNKREKLEKVSRRYGGKYMNNKSLMKIDENGAKLKLIFLKKKTLFVAILVIVLCAVFVLGGIGISKSALATPVYKSVVVIDPGHGGIDSGVIGKTGYRESDFNLDMAKELSSLLEKAGFKVILTRVNSDGLYADFDVNKKKADMAARKKIIKDNNPDFIISIHANKFPGDNRRGAQVFYDGMNKGGKALADGIQNNLNILNQKNVGKGYSALNGDYFMLKCSAAPSVIVECGFLSNADDEKLLSTPDYRKELAFAIYSGLASYCEA